MADVTISPELQQVLAQARDISHQTQKPLSSAHVLLAMFTVPNLAELLLLERQVNEERLLALIGRLEAEPASTLDELMRLAQQLASGCDDTLVNCLHVLAAVTKLPSSFAYRLLDRAGLSIQTLRRTALRYATHGVPTRLQHMGRALDMEEEEVDEMVRDTVETPALPAFLQDRLVHDPEVVAEVSSPRGRDTAPRPTDRRSGRPGRRREDRTGDEGDRRGSSPPREAAPALPPEDLPSPYVVQRDRFRWLHQLGRNLSHLAWLGRLDPVVGREREIEEAIDVLNKRRSNNPCLVGDPGVGKTAIAEGIAARLVEEHGDREGPPDRVIIQVDVGSIIAGTHLRGSLAERLRGLQEEVRRANGRVVIFIDEIHTLIGAGGGDGAHDAANELKASLARGEFPCIGATTIDEYRQHVESDPALERRFTAVHVDEPDEATTLSILHGVADRYAQHHGVSYLDEAFEAAVRMSRRYIHERKDPDKSLGVLDLAGAVARRERRDVDRRAVAEVVARVARVPVEHLLLDDPQRFLRMEEHLGERIIGQRPVLQAISATIRRNFAGFGGGRPIGSLLFLGPTGVGKTEAVKATAEFLFGSREALTRFDMSEYLESHSVSRLIGSPPGYVGHREGGQLTDVVRRRPYQVILFDEIEKSHRDVWNLLLQVLDDGRLTDGRGRTVDFSNTVIVMTSNLGAEALGDGRGRRIGFADEGSAADARREARALDAARAAFPPELWNRIECRLVFHPLSRDQIRQIARLLLRERADLLANERNIRFEVTEAGIEHLIDHGGYDASLGARPMRQTIANLLESPLAERILAGDIRPGATVQVDAGRDGLDFTTR